MLYKTISRVTKAYQGLIWRGRNPKIILVSSLMVSFSWQQVRLTTYKYSYVHIHLSGALGDLKTDYLFSCQIQGDGGGTLQYDANHFKPIGYIKSVFKNKNGIPRQPIVCEVSRAFLTVEKDSFNNPEHALDGLMAYSHVWQVVMDIVILWKCSLYY